MAKRIENIVERCIEFICGLHGRCDAEISSNCEGCEFQYKCKSCMNEEECKNEDSN